MRLYLLNKELVFKAFDAASTISKNNGPFNESSVFRTVYAELEKNDALDLVINQSSDLFKIRKAAERVAFWYFYSASFLCEANKLNSFMHIRVEGVLLWSERNFIILYYTEQLI